jgi:tetratricopeptide (TPR) repeat protein
MSNDDIAPEDQAAISQVARSVMQKLAAGQTADEVIRELCAEGWQKSTAAGLVEHVSEDWRKIEAEPLAHAGIYLQMKYPQMKPVGSAPTLQTVHGCGTGFYGSRDFDRPTGSYVKTQCFCVLFVPLIAMKSYRVTNRGAGWNLIGRVPLSRFARIWNITFLFAVLACIVYGVVDEYLRNPTSRAGRLLAKADEAAAAGDLLEADRLYREVARTRTGHAAVARKRCTALVERPELDSLSLNDVTQLYDDVIEIRVPGENNPVDVTRGLAIVKAHAQADPPGSIKLLDRIARLSNADDCREAYKNVFQAGLAWVEHHPQAPPRQLFSLLDQLAELPDADPARVASIRRPMLEKLLAANPQDVDLAVQLALALEAEDRSSGKKPENKPAQKTEEGDFRGRIVKLLTPLRDKLGTDEGARLLGQALAAEGKFDDAYALLGPYLETHLEAFHEAERAFGESYERAQARLSDQIRSGTAPGFDFSVFQEASDDKKQAMLVEYFSERIKDDADVEAARQRLAQQGMVVPAALDLGMVMLQRAQTIQDPAARRTELERAEKTFIAIRGTAADADKYMLQLGQVYYWLGKQKEGRAEFEKLLAKNGRSVEVLALLSSVLRDLGAFAEARKMMEEGYEKSTDDRERKEIAAMRAITPTSQDDAMLWLERCDQNNPSVKARLAETRGARAESQGNDDEAAADYREAVTIYEQQPKSSDVLNNGGLACLSLFEVSGDRQAFDRGGEWLEKAVSLSPVDPLVLGNAASQMLRAAIQDLAGTGLNLRELQMSGQVDALYYLARDQKGLDDIRRRAREHAGLHKALNYLDRAIILAPKNSGWTGEALDIYSFLRDREALQRLARQVAAAPPDAEDATKKRLKYYRYEDEDFKKDRMRASIARTESLLARLRGREKGPEYAAALGSLVELKLSTDEDVASDADELVRLADESHHVAPSMATYEPLIVALLHRAGKKLAAEYPLYGQAVHGTGRAAPLTCVVALAMERSDALGKAARQNQDVQRAIALVASRAESFPECRSAVTWALLGAAEPSRADLRAKCLVQDDLGEIERTIGQSLLPLNPQGAFETYWRRLATGAPNAREPLDKLVKLGVPLPVGLIDAQKEE